MSGKVFFNAFSNQSRRDGGNPMNPKLNLLQHVGRTFVDAHCVQASGAKVNNNKCASALFMQSLGGGKTDR